MGRVKLPGGHRFDAGAHHFADIRPVIQPQGNEAHHDHRQAHARIGQNIIKKTHLQNQGRILEKFHINPGDGLQRLVARCGEKPQGEPDDQGDNQGDSRRFQGVQKSLDKGGPVSPDGLPGPGA